MRISVHRVIKLLTLVQDSSIEQKLELFPLAKVRNYLATSKKNAKNYSCNCFFSSLALAAIGVSGLSFSNLSNIEIALSIWSSLT